METTIYAIYVSGREEEFMASGNASFRDLVRIAKDKAEIKCFSNLDEMKRNNPLWVGSGNHYPVNKFI